MGDEGGRQQLPQRARGAARAGPGTSPSSAPTLSEEMRQRLRAAVEAERAVNAEPDSGSEPASKVPANHQPAAVVQTPADRSKPPEAHVRSEPHRRRLVIAALALVAIAAGALTAVLAGHIAGSSADGSAPALQRQERLARDQAASWVAQQVDHNALVSCDRVMCAALAADGFPSRGLLVLGLASPAPVTSNVVIVTAAVRNMFGSSLGSAYAPAILASFGSGTAEITIRVMARGAAAYQAAANSDLKARKISDAALFNDNRIMISPMAKEQLAAGQVDARLVLAIASVAGGQPIDIVQFGNIGQGASAGLPLRFADLAVTYHGAHMTSSAYVRAMRASLNSANIPYHPVSAETAVLPDGQTVFRVEFTAPSPFGVLSPQGSS